MQGKGDGVTTFALVGVRCTRLEHGYMPNRYYHNQLPPIYEDAVDGNPDPARQTPTFRRSSSPMNVLTNGSFYNNYEIDKTFPRQNSNNMRQTSSANNLNNVIRTSSVRRYSSDVTLNSSKMLNDMIGRKYRRKSDPCLPTYKPASPDYEQTLESNSNSSSESLFIDIEGSKGTKRKESGMTSNIPRSSIYDCSMEKKIRKRLFLLCFGIFVLVVVFFLVSIMTGLIFPEAMYNKDQTAYVHGHTVQPNLDLTTQNSLDMNNNI